MFAVITETHYTKLLIVQFKTLVLFNPRKLIFSVPMLKLTCNLRCIRKSVIKPRIIELIIKQAKFGQWNTLKKQSVRICK